MSKKKRRKPATVRDQNYDRAVATLNELENSKQIYDWDYSIKRDYRDDYYDYDSKYFINPRQQPYAVSSLYAVPMPFDRVRYVRISDHPLRGDDPDVFISEERPQTKAYFRRRIAAAAKRLVAAYDRKLAANNPLRRLPRRFLMEHCLLSKSGRFIPYGFGMDSMDKEAAIDAADLSHRSRQHKGRRFIDLYSREREKLCRLVLFDRNQSYNVCGRWYSATYACSATHLDKQAHVISAVDRLFHLHERGLVLDGSPIDIDEVRGLKRPRRAA